MAATELYEIYRNQQVYYFETNEHNDGFEHFDYPHQDFYTDEPESSPGW